MKTKKVGEIGADVVRLLSLDIEPGTPIFLGESNLQHMKTSHPEAFEKYFSHLQEILQAPDYVNRNPRDGSIKYLKRIDDVVVVGVRISMRGNVFARTIFTFEDWKFAQYERKGYLKACNKKTRPKDASPEDPRQGD